MKLSRFYPGALCAVLCAGTVWAEPLETRIVPSYRAADLVAVVSPLLDGNGSVGVYQGQLVIRASAAKQEEIARLLEQLDRPARNVMISVRRSGQEAEDSRGINTRARIRYPQGSQARIDIHDTQRREQSSSVHTARTLENAPAFIDTGEAIPVPVINYGPGGVSSGYGYQGLMRGFEATPQLLPNGQVRLEIRYRYENTQPGSRQIASQSADSVLMLAPGQWQAMGGVSESASSSQRGILSKEVGSSSRELPLEVKVDVLD